MSSLQYLVGSGALLYGTGGALARECCCEIGGACECDPALDWTYTVTLSGFAGASDTRYDCADGDWDVDYIDECTWEGYHTAGGCGSGGTTRYWVLTLELVTTAAPQYWRVRLQFTNSFWAVPGVCIINWKLDLSGSPSGDPCTDTPPGSYTFLTSDNLCAGDADQSGVISCSVV